MITKLKQSKKPIISIIIPTLNEELFLPKLLDSILKQDFEEYEVIVADANSKDKTKQIALDYGAKVVKGGMPSVGRNRGADEAKGEYLFFFDADVILPKQFLSNSLNEIKLKRLDFATCDIIPLSNYIIDEIMFEIYFLFSKISSELFKDTPILGCAFFISKELFFKVGQFNEKIVFAEDYDLSKRARKRGNFGFLNSVKLPLSMRRLDKEGRVKFLTKTLYAYLYIKLFKSIEKEIFDYEFGNYSELEKKSFVRRLEKLRDRLRKLSNEMSGGIKERTTKSKMIISNVKKKVQNLIDTTI